MAVISILLIESEEEIVSGIPKTVSVETNVPSTVFYTLDGSEPTTSSSVYVLPIQLPTLPAPTLKVFATNGIDTSSIVEKSYGPSLIGARLPHATITGLDINAKNSLGLFGSNSQDIEKVVLTNPSDSGITVLVPELPTYTSGRVDADGYDAALTNEPLIEYKLIETTTNVRGETGKGIGTLTPVTKLPERNNAVPEESKTSSKLFNPRAMVIFQDAETEDQSAPPFLNRESFTLEIQEKDRDGGLNYNHGPDTPTSTGYFIKSFFNPRDNTITYYYRDSVTNRWIISKQPYVARDPSVGNLSSMFFGRENGVGKVFAWAPFRRRVLT